MSFDFWKLERWPWDQTVWFGTGVNEELIRNVKQVLLELCPAKSQITSLHFPMNILPTRLLAFQLLS